MSHRVLDECLSVGTMWIRQPLAMSDQGSLTVHMDTPVETSGEGPTYGQGIGTETANPES